MGVRWGLGRDTEVWGIFDVGSGYMHIFFVNTPFCCIFLFYAHDNFSNAPSYTNSYFSKSFSAH